MAPNGYNDDELAAMMTDIESDLVERKQSLSDNAAEKVSRSICAFANDLPNHGRAGVILIGVTDDGKCAGLNIDDRLLKRLADMRDDGRTLPLPSLDVQRRRIDGCDVAAVMVHPSAQPPVRYGGRVWVRVGPTVRVASAEDERRLSERRRHRDSSFDLRSATDASRDDLDLDLIERTYLPRVVASDVLAENQRPLLQQLRSLRLLNDDTPTWGALLAFGRDPRYWRPSAYVQFVRYSETEIGDSVIDEELVSGQLRDVLDGINRILRYNIRTKINIGSGPQERRLPDYPLNALVQFAHNAVMHREYEDSRAPARINWFSDRVEMLNPGSLFGDLTLPRIRHGDTAYRNQLIAEIMKNLGYAQRFGTGITLASRALEENGNPPPEFAADYGLFHVTVRSAE